MIYFLTTAAHQYTIRRHFRSYGADLKKLIRPMSYEQLFRSRRLPRGVYIFSDIERLWPEQAELAAKFWHVMNEQGFRLLNHPTRSLRRYDLLRTMYLRGSNRFNVYRLPEHRMPEKYPVYLRGENDHNANRTPLLHNGDELQAALAQVDAEGRSRDNTLIVEFCDVGDSNGIYRKYSAFCVGGVLVPRHLCFAKKWMVKQPRLTDPHLLQEEQEYLDSNPHDRELREIFQTARIDYGRIDYALADGVIQVWEINTNPTICMNAVAGGAVRTALQREFARKLQAAFKDLLASSAVSAGAIRVNPNNPTRVRKPKTFVQRLRQALRVEKWRAA